MNPETVLVDVLRGRAAEVSVDGGALAAILSADPPGGNSSGPATPTGPGATLARFSGGGELAEPGSSGTSGQAPRTAGRWLKRIFSGFGAVAIVAVAVGIGYIAMAEGDARCPALPWVNQELNKRLNIEGVDVPVEIPCQAGLATADEIIEAVPAELRPDLRRQENYDEIEAWIECLSAVTTPIELGSLDSVQLPTPCLSVGS